MSDSLTRDKIALTISERMGLPVSKTRKFVDLTLARMSDGIIHDDKLMLSNFGTFHVHAKKERMGRNPKTGEEVMITPRRVVSFKASRNISNPTERTDS
jgi:integration host factor subunit alpha